ncbi:competence ComEA-like helix-hairpin-helix protein [Lewinella aquimaris]|uniref:Competence ComEA-like helix-hairpin-helix protein n=1 Tax=Neolewinella aquimaris TaxID=1835722 RepID=A0A840DXW0_9BACT|nr:helix-hairpin-helix domain-containing protein [Neolewinella aquimaris]MBB4077770.1 competence ComEA-like helix-hairpin-helix protein [Neolewinella aquimaris]
MPPPGAPNPWSYTRNQRFGLLLLLILITAFYMISRAFASSSTTFASAKDPELLIAAARLRAIANKTPQPGESVESFRFNPNQVSVGELQRLGLSAKQAAAFTKFRDKRPFRHPDEIAKLYVLRPEQAHRLIGLAEIPAPKAPEARTKATATPPPAQRFPFDPNTLPADSLRLLGFTEWETNALLKYRSYRPVTFRRPTDLHRVSVLDSAKVNDLLDLITISQPNSPSPATIGAYPPANETSAPVDVNTAIDVNTATTEEWTRLPGIGPYRAEQIVAYRESLGGFARVEQVAATYGLPDSVYASIAPHLRWSPITRPLYINRATAAELGRHPLLKMRTAEIIVRYRDNHGPFASAEDLKKVRALSTENLDALLPYLNFDR